MSETTDTVDGGTTRLEIEHRSSHTVIRLVGDHDCTTSSELLRELDGFVAERDVILDLDEARFIDSSVLHTIVRGQRTACAAGRTVSVSIASAHPLRRVLELTNLGVEITDSADDDRRAVASSRPSL